MASPEICIAGAGIIGLALALELDRRGARVLVLERDEPMTQASQAAAGMLAARDPDNPPALSPLAELSLRLYPDFLDRIERLGGHAVPFQTDLALQASATGFLRLNEHSIDPRQLAPALHAAIRRSRVQILERTSIQTIQTVEDEGSGLALTTNAGKLNVGQLVHTLGAWSFAPVAPRKGQMLAVRIPNGLNLDYVIRSEEIYVVPRTAGPRAGQAVIGATVEDAGFSTGTDLPSLHRLRTLAADLIPELGDEGRSPMLDHWAGLRPYTPDHLPILGRLGEAPSRQFVATGHYRNGILLAPATARVMAQMLAGEQPSVDLGCFSPARFPVAPPHLDGNGTPPPIFAQLS